MPRHAFPEVLPQPSPESAPRPRLRALEVVTVSSFEEWKRLWEAADDEDVQDDAPADRGAHLRLLAGGEPMDLNKLIIDYLAEEDPDEVRITDAGLEEDAEWAEARKEWSREVPTKEIPQTVLRQLQWLSAKR